MSDDEGRRTDNKLTDAKASNVLLTDGGERQETPADAFEAAVDLVENCRGDRIDQINAEDEAADFLLDSLAYAVHVDEIPRSRTGTFLGNFADISGFTKTELRNLFSETLSTLKREASGMPPITSFLENRLESVQIAKSTDHHMDTDYGWNFDTFVVQTSASGSGMKHVDPRAFALLIFGESRICPDVSAFSGDDGGGEWIPYITELIDSNAVETVTHGALTTAVDELENQVRNATGYETAEAAAERNGIFLPGNEGGRGGRRRAKYGTAPENEDADAGENAEEWRNREIWIPNERVLAVCDEWDLRSPKALQMELDARGHTVEGIRGASHRTTVNGDLRTYWILAPDFADVEEFMENPANPAELARDRIEREEAENETANRGEEADDETGDKRESDNSDHRGSPRDRATFGPLRDEADEDDEDPESNEDDGDPRDETDDETGGSQ